jgi:hypothetical protein
MDAYVWNSPTNFFDPFGLDVTVTLQQGAGSLAVASRDDSYFSFQLAHNVSPA